MSDAVTFTTGAACEMRATCRDSGYCVGHCFPAAAAPATDRDAMVARVDDWIAEIRKDAERADEGDGWALTDKGRAEREVAKARLADLLSLRAGAGAGAEGDKPFGVGSTTVPGLSKVVEEFGELNQVLGKIMAVGGFNPHWDGSDLRAKAVEEAGDALAAVRYFAIANGLEEEVEARYEDKLATFWRWHWEAYRIREGEPAYACAHCQDGFIWPDGEDAHCPKCDLDRIPF